MLIAQRYASSHLHSSCLTIGYQHCQLQLSLARVTRPTANYECNTSRTPRSAGYKYLPLPLSSPLSFPPASSHSRWILSAPYTSTDHIMSNSSADSGAARVHCATVTFDDVGVESTSCSILLSVPTAAMEIIVGFGYRANLIDHSTGLMQVLFMDPATGTPFSGPHPNNVVDFDTGYEVCGLVVKPCSAGTNADSTQSPSATISASETPAAPASAPVPSSNGVYSLNTSGSSSAQTNQQQVTIAPDTNGDDNSDSDDILPDLVERDETPPQLNGHRDQDDSESSDILPDLVDRDEAPLSTARP